MGRVYRYDLLGAGLGAAGAVGVLFLVPPSVALKLLIALGFAAAGIAHLGSGETDRRSRAAILVLCGLLLAWLEPGSTFAPRLSEFKWLSSALNAPGAEVIH